MECDRKEVQRLELTHRNGWGVLNVNVRGLSPGTRWLANIQYDSRCYVFVDDG